jgi:hypothetical protein
VFTDHSRYLCEELSERPIKLGARKTLIIDLLREHGEALE